jgi:hypothetical protein
VRRDKQASVPRLHACRPRNCVDVYLAVVQLEPQQQRVV